MQIKQELISPKKAEELLATNFDNRKMRKRRVMELAGAIQRGEWQSENPSPIVIGTDGRLVDGQHRLAAVVEAGKSVKMLVATGIKDPTVADTIDTGAPRSFFDLLSMRGEPNATLLAAATRQIWMWRNYKFLGGSSAGFMTPTHRQLLALLDEEPAIRMGVEYAASQWKGGRAARFQIPPAGIAAMYYLFSEIDDEQCDLFWQKVRDGEDIKRGDPIFALRRFLLKDGVYRRPPRVTCAVIIKAWKLWKAGENIESLMWRATGRTPEPFPSID